ncbi:Glutamine-Leucine-Glutamine QLQ [Arabidopsis suecica]|uniref:Growth-regulating factor n=1 Tax=Arabidopsis suecica TaxID=45249 RepID=A0A8T1YK21_ARASU|nr:Glutamine-Leucine-Glutamine QLQ [Arabidopsis suecica]
MGTRAERKEDFVGGFGFGVVENSHKDVMVLPHHHYHPSYSSPSSYSSLCYCSAGVSDPMFSVSSNQAYTSSYSNMFSHAGSASTAVTVADPFFSSSSSGEMRRSMNEDAGAAFSEAQWQELERQRNIYKYMMASVPVPPELLTPFTKNHPSNTNPDVTVAVAKGGSLQLGIASSTSNNSADLEPWRCKRTDGKKWRCSRNVIPDQKYCERHTHKSRPRSRKHVESSHQSSHHNDIPTTKNDTSQFARTYPQFYGQPISQIPVLSTLPSASSSYDHHRGLRWFRKEDDAIGTLNPEIQEAVQLKVGSSRELKRGFDYDLNFRQKEPVVDQSFGTVQGLLSLNETPQHNQETRRFVVEGKQDEAMGSSLTLSMAGGGMEEAEGTSQHQWVSHEGPSWLYSTTPGGPLAEALCLGVSNNPSSSTTTSSCSRSSS